MRVLLGHRTDTNSASCRAQLGCNFLCKLSLVTQLCQLQPIVLFGEQEHGWLLPPQKSVFLPSQQNLSLFPSSLCPHCTQHPLWHMVSVLTFIGPNNGKSCPNNANPSSLGPSLWSPSNTHICMYEDENTIRSVLRIYCHMTSYHKSLKQQFSRVEIQQCSSWVIWVRVCQGTIIMMIHFQVH